jgi:hypothetical protein
MITQQLLDFIKEQLKLGTPREKISADLLANGWTRGDIEEGFENVEKLGAVMLDPRISVSIKTTKKSSGLKTFFLVLLLFLLIIGAGGYYFRSNLISLPMVKQVIDFKNKLLGQEEIPIPIEEETATEPTSEPIACADEDINCFMNASYDCSPSTVNWSNGIDFFGVSQVDKSKLSFEGLDSSGKCIFSYLVEDSSIILEPGNKIQAKSRGMTDAQIEQKIQEADKIVKKRIGMNTKCLFETENLAHLLTRWSEANIGNDSFKDLSVDSCKTTDMNGEIIKIINDTKSDYIPDYIDSSLMYKTMTLVSVSKVLDVFSGLIFEVSNLTKDQIKINITQEKTKEKKLVTFIVGKKMEIFGNIIIVTEIKEKTYGIDPVLKRMEAILEITKK